MDQTSEQRLAKVHPALAARVRTVVAKAAAQGVELRVVQGLRTHAEQETLFAQGRTRPGEIVTKARGGESNHNFGLAVDLCPFKNGKPQWDDNSSFLLLGSLAEAAGLTWGGRWKKLIDKPHLELPGLTIAECRKLYAKGKLRAVWNSPKLPA